MARYSSSNESSSDESSLCFLDQDEPGFNLDTFITDELQPDSEQLEECGEEMEALVEFLQQDIPLSVKKVVKGGSFGKGTAVKGKSDLDVVVYLNDIPGMKQFRSDLPKIIKSLASGIRRHQWGEGVSVHVLDSTKHAVELKIRVSSSGDYMYVDVLPVIDTLDFKPGPGRPKSRNPPAASGGPPLFPALFQGSGMGAAGGSTGAKAHKRRNKKKKTQNPPQGSPHTVSYEPGPSTPRTGQRRSGSLNVKGSTPGCTRVYREMSQASPKNRQYYSASLAPLQLKFVKSKPTDVKKLIQLVKHWRKTSFDERGNEQALPKSYLLELITIHAWDEAGQPPSLDMKQGFKTVMLLLKNYNTLDASWSDNYNLADFRSYEADLYTRPCVMDPANPFNNMCSGCRCWEEVKEAAERALRKPLLRRVQPLFDV